LRSCVVGSVPVTQGCCCLMVGNSYRKNTSNQVFEHNFSVDV